MNLFMSTWKVYLRIMVPTFSENLFISFLGNPDFTNDLMEKDFVLIIDFLTPLDVVEIHFYDGFKKTVTKSALKPDVEVSLF